MGNHKSHKIKSLWDNKMEITLHTDEQHSFVCCLSSLNLAKYDEWKDTDLIYTATWFLDGVLEEFIQKAKNMKGFENAVRSAEKGRALGLGCVAKGSKIEIVESVEIDGVSYNVDDVIEVDGEKIKVADLIKIEKSSTPVENICISKDGKHKYIKPDNLNSYLDDGWIIGFSNTLKNKLKDIFSKNKEHEN